MTPIFRCSRSIRENREILKITCYTVYPLFNNCMYNNIEFLYPLKEQLLHRLTSQERGREKDITGEELEVRYTN